MLHCYQLGGLNIVLDIYSGSVHLVDEVAYDIISMYESTPREEIVRVILGKYGDREDVTEEEAEKTAAAFIEKFDDESVMLVPGGQPVYYYIISAE